MIAAACTVVWVVSGYDALASRFDDMADDYLGRYDLVIVPASPRDEALSDQLVADLAADQGVLDATPIFQTSISIRPVRAVTSERSAASESPAAVRGGRGGGEGRGGSGGNRMRMERPSLLGLDTAEPPYPIVAGRWLTTNVGEELQGVLSQGAAKQYGVKVGDTITVVRAVDGRGGVDPDAKPLTLSVVGLIEQVNAQSSLMPRGDAPRGAARGPASSALYVLPIVAEKIAGKPFAPHMACIKLDSTMALSKFRNEWEPRLRESTPVAQIVTSTEVESGLESSFSTQGLRSQAYAATGMSLLASLFIIFSTLSMGVSERSRQFAMMRAVALSRSQIAGVIAVEGLLLAAIGWGGGLLAGWGLLNVMKVAKPELFEQGASLGWQCVVLSGICAIGGTLLASIAPMWRAINVEPLEAMKSSSQRFSPHRLSLGALVAGIVLILLAPFLAFFVSLEDETAYAISSAVGLASLIVGFLLLAPACVLLTERMAGPALAKLLGVDYRLLRSQLSSSLWRTIGAAGALTIGLGLYAATQTWGHSMLQPFVPGPWMPDAVVRFPNGVSDVDLAEVAASSAVQPGKLLPLAVEQPKLTDDVTRSEERMNATRADNVVLVGLDVERAFAGLDPMFHLEFVDGDPATAVKSLKAGNACLIADFLQTEAGLKVGDQLRMTPPTAPEETVEYTIVGVVTQPGVHWLTKMSGLRRRGGLMAGIVFAPYDDVKRDFAADRNDFFWLNLADGSTVADLQTSLEPIAARNGNHPQEESGFARMVPGTSPTNLRSSIVVTTTADVRNFVTWRAADVIWGMSQLPLITLAIASIGMLNTVTASIRSRRWEFGVLRAVGLPRSGLFRLVMAEALLVGLVACVLSLGFGVVAGYSGTGLARYVYRHGGHVVPLTIPWWQLFYGFAGALLLCLAAALIPAFRAGRSELLTLLQPGRLAS